LNRLPKAKRKTILNLICRSNCVADIADITGCSTTTIRRELGVLGEALAAFHDQTVRGLTCSRIQADESWSYVYCKRDVNLTTVGAKRPPPADRGKYFTWVAIDPDTKLLVSWMVGDRSVNTGIPFLLDLRSRVLNRPLISTDAHVVYPSAVQHAFGSDADHVLLDKNIESWKDIKTGEAGSRYLGATKIPLNQTKVDLKHAGTSYVERFQGSIRNSVSRMTRQTYKFSKKLANHIHHQAIYVVYYNFTKRHTGFRGQDRNYTPAMKAGITKKIWSYDDLIDVADEYWRKKAVVAVPHLTSPPQYTPLTSGEWSDRPYFVSYSEQYHRAKVHASTCRDTKRAAKGRKDGPRANKWYAFQTEGGARRCAEILSPTDHSVCSICIVGHYAGNMVAGRGQR